MPKHTAQKTGSLRSPRGTASAYEARLDDAPEQLELFPPRGEEEGWFVADAPRAAAALAEALDEGRAVSLRRAPHGFEVRIAREEPREPAPRARPGETCGYARRAVEVLVRAAESKGCALWARPAGAGWTEWGTLTASNDLGAHNLP